MSEPRAILVRGPNWLGDLVMSTPGLRALRRRFPHARIDLHVRASLAPLCDGLPWVDDVLPLASYHRGAVAMLREGGALRARGYDLGLCIPESWSSLLLMRAAGVPRVAGYRGQGRGWLLDPAVPAPAEWGRRRLVARERFVLELARALGCEAADARVELFTTDDEESRADALLSGHGLGAGDRLVALAPGASYGPSKLWPAESFAAVGDGAARAGARVLVLGTDGEAPLCDRVRRAMSHPASDLSGAMDLGVFKAVVRRCRVLVANDAGARHVAVALGVPSVVMLGPTSLEKTSLNLERVRVLETDVECRPCYHRVCPIDHRCMTRLSPEEATRAMLDQLVSRDSERPLGSREGE